MHMCVELEDCAYVSKVHMKPLFDNLIPLQNVIQQLVLVSLPSHACSFISPSPLSLSLYFIIALLLNSYHCFFRSSLFLSLPPALISWLCYAMFSAFCIYSPSLLPPFHCHSKILAPPFLKIGTSI